MLKLMSLEIRKHKLLHIFKSAAIANLILLAFFGVVILIDRSEAERTFESYRDMFDGLFVIVKGVYIIFAAVLLGRLVISEYRNNTISLLFMYPIPRKKLMTAKLIIVFLFTLLTITCSTVLLGAILIGINQFVDIIPGQLTDEIVLTQLVKIGIGALYAAGIGLIPLYVGMRKKSVSATIVTGVLVVSLISSGFDQFRLGDLAAVSIFLSLLGIGVAYMSIRNIETEDIT